MLIRMENPPLAHKKGPGIPPRPFFVFYAALTDFLSFCNQILNDMRLCQG